MKNNTRQNGGDTTAAITRTQTIKLGLDVHVDSIVVVRILDHYDLIRVDEKAPVKGIAARLIGRRRRQQRSRRYPMGRN